MTDRIAHQVHEWIHHPLHQELVDLRFATAELHDDLLTAFTRQVANHERHALKDFTDLDHAHAHDTLAQISQLPSHALACFLERTPERSGCHSFQLRYLILKPRTTVHELPDDAHQFVEPVEIDAHNGRRSDRRDWLAVFDSRRGFDWSGLERQTISFKTCKRIFVRDGGNNKLEGNLAGAFNYWLCPDQVSNLLQA